MDIRTAEVESRVFNAQQWINCSDKLPATSQYVFYRTPDYIALGKHESKKWFSSADDVEPETNPVISWRPLN